MASIWKRPKGKGNHDAKWLITYSDCGKRRTIVGSSNYKDSQQIARRLEQREALRRRGLIDPVQERLAEEAKRPIGSHIDDYEEHLAAQGAGHRHLESTIGYVREVSDALNWVTVRSILADRVMRYLAEQSRANGTGKRTFNARLVAVKSFTRWLVAHGRLAADPMAAAKRLRETDDRRRVRRTLTADEFERLIRAAETGPLLWSIPGRDRAMLWRVLAGTGLRRSEAGSLARRSFDLGGADGPVVRVAAAYTKNGKEVLQPIPDALTAVLVPWLATRKPDEPLWRLPERTAERLLYPDLKRAGIDYGVEGGPVIDCHSFRHGFITTLVRAGVPVKSAQRLARHSDPRLTLNIYSHLTIADDRAALAQAFGTEQPHVGRAAS